MALICSVEPESFGVVSVRVAFKETPNEDSIKLLASPDCKELAIEVLRRSGPDAL